MMMTSAEIAGCAIAATYIAGFVAQSSHLARRAGKAIWLFGKGGEPQALPALLFRLSFAGAIIWPAALAIAGYPARQMPLLPILDSSWSDAFGLLLIVIGAGLALSSQHYMGASWRIGAADGQVGDIVDRGPFAWSRNPVFVGQGLVFAGLFLALPNLVQAALTLAFLVAIPLQVRIEERVLLRTLGEPYRVYCDRVPRWIGIPARG